MSKNKRVNQKTLVEDEELARIRKRAEMIPSDEECDEEESEEDEMTRIQRRAEMVPSDDDDVDNEDSDDESTAINNVGKHCEIAEGSSDDGSDSEDDESDDDQNMPLPQQEEEFSEEESSEEEEDDEDFSSDDDDEYPSRTRPLNEIPLHERLELKMNGSDSNPYAKKQKKKLSSSSMTKREQWNDNEEEEQQPQQKKSKKSKHAPMEQSSKWAVGRYREVIATKKSRVRDPRFEEMGSTPLTGKTADEAYSFLDDKRKNELQKLHNEIRKERKKRGGRAGGSDSKIEILKAAELRLKQAEYESIRKRSEKSALTAWKQQEKASVAAGKQPFYLKRKAAKELLLEARFDGIRKGKGGKKRVEKILERKRKKSIAKERKWIPEERRN